MSLSRTRMWDAICKKMSLRPHLQITKLGRSATVLPIPMPFASFKCRASSRFCPQHPLPLSAGRDASSFSTTKRLTFATGNLCDLCRRRPCKTPPIHFVLSCKRSIIYSSILLTLCRNFLRIALCEGPFSVPFFRRFFQNGANQSVLQHSTERRDF